MKRLLIGTLFSLASLSASAGGPYSVSETDIGTLMEDPAARAILETYLPDTVSNEQFGMSYGFTLEFIQGFDPSGEISDENLSKIDAALKALPAE